MRLVHIDVSIRSAKGTLQTAVEAEQPLNGYDWHELWEGLQLQVWCKLQGQNLLAVAGWEVFVECYETDVGDPIKERFYRWLRQNISRHQWKWTEAPNDQVHQVKESDLL